MQATSKWVFDTLPQIANKKSRRINHTNVWHNCSPFQPMFAALFVTNGPLQLGGLLTQNFTKSSMQSLCLFISILHEVYVISTFFCTFNKVPTDIRRATFNKEGITRKANKLFWLWSHKHQLEQVNLLLYHVRLNEGGEKHRTQCPLRDLGTRKEGSQAQTYLRKWWYSIYERTPQRWSLATSERGEVWVGSVLWKLTALSIFGNSVGSFEVNHMNNLPHMLPILH